MNSNVKFRFLTCQESQKFFMWKIKFKMKTEQPNVKANQIRCENKSSYFSTATTSFV